MNILEIRNLCKVYGSGETRVDALKNVSFDVGQGEFVAIVGGIGSGKSCLVNAILSNYHIFSQDENPIINGEISFCPQQPWITTNTIKHNIDYILPSSMYIPNINKQLEIDGIYIPDKDFSLSLIICISIKLYQKSNGPTCASSIGQRIVV